jgi:DNA polymerase III delta prime subunit
MISQESRKISYIQQSDEFDYLRNLIESFEKGICIGILLHGPPGTGKTLLAITLADSFNASYYIIDGSPDLDRRDIEGYWELYNSSTRFNYGPLTLAVEEANKNGIAFIIINEINAIRESEQISLNSLLSENHINLISKGFEKYELNPNSKLIIIGTLNKGVIGINKLQEAFEDRFIVCPEINYPIRKKEVEIATKISGCDENVAEIVVDVARQIRKQALNDFSITKIFSTRLIVNFCIVISKMSPSYLRHNIQNVIINKLGENQEEKKSIAMILDGKMFADKLKRTLIPESQNTEHNKRNNISLENNEKRIVEIMKINVRRYIELNGKSSIINTNKKIKWKFLEWFWKHKRMDLKNYVQLTEKLELHKDYKKSTGKNHSYNGHITLRYIRWLFQKRMQDLINFMKVTCPILD